SLSQTRTEQGAGHGAPAGRFISTLEHVRLSSGLGCGISAARELCADATGRSPDHQDKVARAGSAQDVPCLVGEGESMSESIRCLLMNHTNAVVEGLDDVDHFRDLYGAQLILDLPEFQSCLITI